MNDQEEYTVIISDQARRMLVSHIRFMAQVDREAAVSKKEEIMNALYSLRQFPQRFPFFNEAYITPNKYRKMFIKKWYIILYQIKEQTVYVDYILDCRKNYTWLMD